MQFSLIMATLGRTKEVDKALSSFKNQSFKDFEIIIVDQNPEGFLDKIIKKYKQLNIKHIQTKKKGLSRARNLGIKAAKGKILCFPDDDCEYEKNTLEEVNEIFTKTKVDILNVKVIDKKTKKVSAGSKLSNPTIIRKNNIHEACSVALFFNEKVIKKVGGFDEKLGAGMKYGSGEETDYLLRALYEGFQINFEPAIKVYHPEDEMKNISHRSRAYGRGWGHMYKKHALKYKKVYAIYQFKKYSLGALALSIINLFKNKQNSKKYWNIFLGMLEGLK